MWYGKYALLFASDGHVTGKGRKKGAEMGHGFIIRRRKAGEKDGIAIHKPLQEQLFRFFSGDEGSKPTAHLQQRFICV